MYKNRRPYKRNHIPDSLKYPKKITASPKEYTNPTKEEIKELEKLTNISTLLEKFKLSQDIFDEDIKKYESTPIEYFKPETNDIDDLLYVRNFLYHGLRFQKHLEKLESIFKDKAILAGNYHDKYYSYNDNCNEGEYISLTSFKEGYSLSYQTFIMINISLIISPECNAIKTIYLKYEDWEKVKDTKTNNRYSYAMDEYQVKEKIPLELVKGIGLPANHLREINREYLIDIYLNDILDLMEKYNIDLPIVDTSYNNRPIYTPKHYKSKRRILKK